MGYGKRLGCFLRPAARSDALLATAIWTLEFDQIT
jgi:hypothetical protein